MDIYSIYSFIEKLSIVVAYSIVIIYVSLSFICFLLVCLVEFYELFAG